MRVIEFATIDVYEESLLEVRAFLRLSPHLFEDSANYKEFKQFIDLHRNPVPTIGMFYSPVHILGIPVGDFISVSTLQESAELVDDKNQSLSFRCNKGTVRFPFKGRGVGDGLLATLLFDNEQEKEQWLTVLHIKYAHWHISVTVRG